MNYAGIGAESDKSAMTERSSSRSYDFRPEIEHIKHFGRWKPQIHKERVEEEVFISYMKGYWGKNK